MSTWQARAANITAAMLGMDPKAGLAPAGGWSQAWHDAVTAGLDASVVGRIARITGWTPQEVCQVADVPVSKAAGEGRLDRLASDRIFRVAWIAAVALAALDGSHLGPDWFREWSRQPFEVLDGHTPIALMRTVPGSLRLREALDAWLHGIPM